MSSSSSGLVAAAAVSTTVLLLTYLLFTRRSSKEKHTLLTVDEFKHHYAAIREDIITTAEAQHELPSTESAHLKRLCDYTVPGGKVNRGLTVVHVAQTMNPIAASNSLRSLAALGWSVEWMQASFLVADDMMDSSITRRGNPCWYLVPEVGSTAINDSLILLTQCEMLLSRYLSKHAFLPEMREILLQTIYQTELGQLMDLSTQPPGATKVHFDKYTMDRYRHIVKYKTAFYSFVAPVRLGMLFAMINDAELHRRVSDVCLLMGEYFQIQDDVLDVYGAPEVIGKIGTDIQDAKCSWLVVTAMNLATPAQKRVLELNYGKKGDAQCEATIKALFTEMRLEAKFADYEAATVARIQRMIDELGNAGAKKVCAGLLSKIYKREK